MPHWCAPVPAARAHSSRSTSRHSTAGQCDVRQPVAGKIPSVRPPAAALVTKSARDLSHGPLFRSKAEITEAQDERLRGFRLSGGRTLMRTVVSDRRGAPRLPRGVAAAAVTCEGSGAASAIFSTSSIVETMWTSSVSSTFFGMSARSFSLSRGRMIVFTPARCARQDLFLHAADRQDLAAQRDLAGHRDVTAHRQSRSGRDQRRRHRDPGRRSVLGDGAFGHVHVDVDLRWKTSRSRTAGPRRT